MKRSAWRLECWLRRGRPQPKSHDRKQAKRQRHHRPADELEPSCAQRRKRTMLANATRLEQQHREESGKLVFRGAITFASTAQQLLSPASAAFAFEGLSASTLEVIMVDP